MITPHQLIWQITTFDFGDGVAFDGKFVCVGSVRIPVYLPPFLYVFLHLFYFPFQPLNLL